MDKRKLTTLQPPEHLIGWFIDLSLGDKIEAFNHIQKIQDECTKNSLRNQQEKYFKGVELEKTNQK